MQYNRMKIAAVALTIAAVALAIVCTGAQVVYAGPYGYDLHNTLAPASGGMAGTSIARPQDNVSSVFGNPATLSQFGGTQFTFGATFYMPVVDLEHDGSVTGTAFKETSGTDIFPVPQIAVTQDLRGLNIPGTLGLGLTAVSGIGTDFRGNAGSLGAGAEFIIFGVNAGLGLELTNDLSLGAAATISFAQLDLGLSSSSAETHALGLRGTIGMTYDIGDTTLGGFYQTVQKHEYDNLIETSPGTYASPTITQPQNFGIGIANNSLMGGDLLIMVDVMYKLWGSADFWEDLYEDQMVYSIGAQLTSGPWRYRLGYGYSEDPTKEDATAPIGDLTQINSSFGVIPLSDPVIQYLQATETEVIYKHRLTVGLGYYGLLGMPGLDLNTHFGWQFAEERDYGTGSLSGGGHTHADVHSWHAGFALTWKY
ncbi:MAG: porin [Desulfobacteraceae bacterium]|jgi:long-chain fatty acid transport protein